jgi:hypothetical protein
VCNVVQQILKHAASGNLDRPMNEKADPCFPGSAAIGFDFLRPLNLRVEGSIPSRLTTLFLANLEISSLKAAASVHLTH